MRALYLEKLPSGDHCELQGDVLHHLTQVVRIKADDELLLLDGKGNKIFGKVEAVSKKTLMLAITHRETLTQESTYDLALVVPKKDALELCLKEATELGFATIYLVRGDYSQMKIPDHDRIKNLLVSALEQSNSAFLPQIQEVSLSGISWNEYQKVLWLDSQSSISEESSVTGSGKDILLVGPEAGFSPDERSYLLEVKNLERVHLPTPIMRTPTAVAAGAGLLLQRLLDKKRYETLGKERAK